MSARDGLFVPGRLCLFGEHSDWAGGYRRSHPDLVAGACLVVGTDQGLHAQADLADSLEITTRLPSGDEVGPAVIGAVPDELDSAARGSDFFSYAAGTAHEMVARFGVGGLRLDIRADLPVRKGLSSSAATCVLVARAYARAYEIELDERGEMEVAYAGERRTGSECGRMDQVCAFGRRVTFLRFDGDAFDVELVEPGGAIDLLVVDLRRGKDTRRILADLNACFPDAPGERASRVRDSLGPRNAEILARARQALERGDAESLGDLMTRAQALFDETVAPASPELSAPRLHEVLDHPAVARHGYGAKGVGSQGDGCAQVVVRSAEAGAELAAILEAELDVHCLPLRIEADESAEPI